MKYLFIFLLIFLFPFSFLVAETWNTCPYGKVNEPAPGTCPRYTDSEGDKICDFSQLSPVDRKVVSLTKNKQVNSVSEFSDESLSDDLINGRELKTKKIYEIAEIYNIKEEDYANALSALLRVKIKLTDTFQFLHDNYGLEPSIAKDVAKTIASGEDLSSIQSEKESTGTRYKLVAITIVFVVIYFITYLLVKFKKMTLLQMRKLWNTILLFSFFGTSILGILLIIRINFGWYINIPFNVLYWHVELGTVMADITIMHIVWHWQYYLRIIKK